MLTPRILLGVTFFACALVAQAQSIENTTLCDIVGNPLSFDGRKVSFRSHIESDGMHGDYLAEPGCKQGLVFGPDNGADWEEMDRIIDKVGFAGTMRKSVEATWTGTIHLNGKVISISAERIENISYELSETWRHVPGY